MPRFAFLALFTAVAFAQNPADLFNKPPAEVDEALRARIKEFYQDHVTQEYRKAEKQVVAEDSQDFFYSHNKPHYLSFEILSIKYLDDFTKARAVVLCEQFIAMEGFLDKPMKIPTPSTWKVVDGKWYWYVDKAELDKTAFGMFKAAPGTPGSLPAAIPTTPDFAMNLVKADRQSVTLKPGQSEQVTITNGAAGYMSLAIQGAVPGVEAKLDHNPLKAGEKAVLTLRAGENATSGALGIRVEQTGEQLPIQVSVESAAANPAATKAVTVDRRSVTLKVGQTEQVTISNGTAGDIRISLEGSVFAVEAKLDRTVLKPGEVAKLTVLAGRSANSGVLSIRVQQTNDVLPIQVIVM